MARRVAGAWGRLLCRLFRVRVRVTGLEHLPREPAVYAANHASALDIPIVFGYLPVDFRIVHKRSLYLIPVLGWYLYLGGHVGIDRENPFRARRSLHAAAERIRAGASVLVFPEGTRSEDGSVRPFKRGSLVLALESGAPVVPLALVGVKRVIPRGVATLRPGEIELRVHPPLSTAGRAVEDAGRLAEQVRRVVAGACA
jgi:1-acyl-sn-glycerol-3-phosphate acyltransferase